MDSASIVPADSIPTPLDSNPTSAVRLGEFYVILFRRASTDGFGIVCLICCRVSSVVDVRVFCFVGRFMLFRVSFGRSYDWRGFELGSTSVLAVLDAQLSTAPDSCQSRSSSPVELLVTINPPDRRITLFEPLAPSPNARF